MGRSERRRDLARKELNGRRVSGWRALERQSADKLNGAPTIRTYAMRTTCPAKILSVSAALFNTSRSVTGIPCLREMEYHESPG